jgi:predicted pyridoxine 5'-phosphate oxidase superfamily flavin-nucleotide-binding protein
LSIDMGIWVCYLEYAYQKLFWYVYSTRGRMNDNFHPGEVAVQAQAGVRYQAEKLQGMYRDQLSPAVRNFVQAQELAVASTVDHEGRVWASLLSGQPGFLHTPTAHLLAIDYQPPMADPLSSQFVDGAALGLLVIDLAERRRVRINGHVALRPDGQLGLAVAQAYGNCPKYIQVREAAEGVVAATAPLDSTQGVSLSVAQQAWIAAADTFFIASYHPQGGADASHRGGMPGFIQVQNATHLTWPDYAGNGLFNTLGNLAEYPQAGLLLIDFATGRSLQLSGRATLRWDPAEVATFPGAERLVEFQIERVIETTGAMKGNWSPPNYSPFNPHV